jgi:biopolymer transport protein ExbD
VISIRLKQKRKYDSRLEIAPLIDVIFILLIFFAVSTTVVLNKGMKLQLPSATTVAKEKKGTVISIDREQRLYIDQKLVAADLLQSKLAEVVKNVSDTQVIIRADQMTPYNFLIRVLDDIRLAGCYDIVLEAEKIVENVHQ